MRTFWSFSLPDDPPAFWEIMRQQQREKEKKEYWARVRLEEEKYRQEHFPNT